MEALLDYKGIQIDPLRQNWRSVPLIMNFVNVVGKALFGKQYEALAPKLPARAGSAVEAKAATTRIGNKSRHSSRIARRR